MLCALYCFFFFCSGTHGTHSAHSTTFTLQPRLLSTHSSIPVIHSSVHSFIHFHHSSSDPPPFFARISLINPSIGSPLPLAVIRHSSPPKLVNLLSFLFFCFQLSAQTLSLSLSVREQQ
jgi:hypothetical protein